MVWTEGKGHGYLQLHGTCEDRRAAEATPLLLEDGLTSDSRGCEHNSGGAPLVHLCRYHSLDYRNRRHGLRCAEPGCWHLG